MQHLCLAASVSAFPKGCRASLEDSCQSACVNVERLTLPVVLDLYTVKVLLVNCGML